MFYCYISGWMSQYSSYNIQISRYVEYDFKSLDLISVGCTIQVHKVSECVTFRFIVRVDTMLHTLFLTLFSFAFVLIQPRHVRLLGIRCCLFFLGSTFIWLPDQAHECSMSLTHVWSYAYECTVRCLYDLIFCWIFPQFWTCSNRINQVLWTKEIIVW